MTNLGALTSYDSTSPVSETGITKLKSNTPVGGIMPSDASCVGQNAAVEELLGLLGVYNYLVDRHRHVYHDYIILLKMKSGR